MIYDNDSIKHLYGVPSVLGGICIFNADTLIKINGYPNNYWGWGREDDCLMMRAKIAQILIDTSNFCQRGQTKKFTELPIDVENGSKLGSKHYNDNSKLYMDEKENPEYSKYNGLSTLQYIIKDTAIDNEVIHIKVYLF